ncbi:TonB-like protein [Rhodopseudomonas palustris HaA2]|uniref:TonB-like protein n=1 Tax=Rhodopseudomonas palustris (strain HaA2) TaxID=316058 RepID=Q2IZJ5_RHOP2|nr:TonB family protein [Rhodopseudomonas palustris]ABD06365.1 TonB-like protein [Rhodopseudomonas palustris HaA2]
MRFGWHDPDARPAGSPRGSRARWLLAAATVTGLHAAAIVIGLNRKPAEAAGEPPAALMLELAPLAVAPDVPQQDLPPGPLLAEAQPEAEPEPETPVEEKVQEIEPKPEETSIEPPPAPVMPSAAVLPPPPKPKPEKKPQPKKKRAADRTKPINPDQPKMTQTSAPPSAQLERSDQMAAPRAGAAMPSAASVASWRGSLMAHLNRHKRFPPGGGMGTASVAFSIDRSGQVRSARLVGSSGDAALDAEAVSLVRRASPVPPPPANVGGSSISLSVPIRFSR